MRDFKSIKAWQRAHAMAVALHNCTRHFRRAGHSRLRAQLVGAADGIHETIAEGAGAESKKEFARFLDMAIKSANETEGHLLSARAHELISPNEWQKFNGETIEIRKMTYTYRKKVQESDDEE